MALGLRIRALTRGVPVSVQAATCQSPHLGASFHGLTDARGDEQTHDPAHITRPRLLSGCDGLASSSASSHLLDFRRPSIRRWQQQQPFGTASSNRYVFCACKRDSRRYERFRQRFSVNSPWRPQTLPPCSISQFHQPRTFRNRQRSRQALCRQGRQTAPLSWGRRGPR